MKSLFIAFIGLLIIISAILWYLGYMNFEKTVMVILINMSTIVIIGDD